MTSTHIQNHLKHLEEEHHKLNKRISGLESTGVFDDHLIEDLKKQKLHIKDEIAKIQADLEKHTK